MRLSLAARFPASLLVVFLVPLSAAAPLRGGQRPIAVSPGDERVALAVASSCPTFSWAADDGAAGYELVVLDLTVPERPQPVVKQRLVAGLGSWTPSGPQCLAPGGSYAWTIRALDAGDARTADEGPWSPPLRFRVPGRPSAEEVAAALDVLRRWQAAEGNDGPTASTAPRAPASGPPGVSGRAAQVSGTSAIRGENPTATGASFGVTGQSASSAGAGLVGINLSSGPDLVLDGAANGEADTSFRQSGIDRSSAGAQTFDIQNSGGGGIALLVQGTAVSLTGHTHAGEEITSGIVADARIAATLTRDAEVMPIVLANDGPGSGLDADTLGGVVATSYQRRVTGSCPAGQTLQGVNADGSVVCAALAAPPRISVVDDPVNSVGLYLSLAVGNDGFPVISYADTGAGALKVAKCNDVACAGANETITAVDDPANSVGQYTSIAIGNDGFPVISYADTTAGALKVAKCNDVACAGANETITTVDDPANSVGQYTSIAIGSDGFPVISYYDATTFALKVVKCNDVACAGGDETITTVDDPANGVGQFSSIAVGNDGFPVIGYYDSSASAVKVAKCNDPACAGGDETITTVDDPADSVGGYLSLAIGADGFPVMSYMDLTILALRVTKCNDAACAGGDETATTVDDPANNVGQHTSIAVGSDGFPVISYYDLSAFALKVARCNDAACAGGDETISKVDDPANSVGQYTSIAIGSDGLPVIGYYDSTAGAVRVAKCYAEICFAP